MADIVATLVLVSSTLGLSALWVRHQAGRRQITTRLKIQ
jgi:hypothetical protein